MSPEFGVRMFEGSLSSQGYQRERGRRSARREQAHEAEASLARPQGAQSNTAFMGGALQCPWCLRMRCRPLRMDFTPGLP